MQLDVFVGRKKSGSESVAAKSPVVSAHRASLPSSDRPARAGSPLIIRQTPIKTPSHHSSMGMFPQVTLTVSVRKVNIFLTVY